VRIDCTSLVVINSGWIYVDVNLINMSEDRLYVVSGDRLDLHLPIQPLPIITKDVQSIPTHVS
jgi:hypothetical protein